MECLVEEGNAIAFFGPLMRAAERGSMQVVVKHGCRDMELCLALTASTSTSQVEVAGYLLHNVPHHVLTALSVEILKAAGKCSGSSLSGVAFLLQSDFLSDPSATYAIADSIARSEDEAVTPELKSFLRENWSEAAFLEGYREAQEHYLEIFKIVKWGESPICLRDLPGPFRVAIAYLPVYRERVGVSGSLLPQRLRGWLVEAATRFGRELLAVLEHNLLSFLQSC